jgi:pimeloyl-ACP methyl ester carboxylesterase
MTLKDIEAGVLRIGYREEGAADGWPVVLLHGFPYDVNAYGAVTPLLVAQGARVIVPYLRGFGPTRFISAETPRSGEQAALGADLLALLAALWPARVRGLVSQNSYNIQDIAKAGAPVSPDNEQRLWYQYYFHGERGRRGLAENRLALCRLLWQSWSPTWQFDAATFPATAPAFDNPDFVDVVIHSYRHRFGLVAGDAAYAAIEAQLAAQPPIRVPTLTLDGADDGVMAQGGTAHHAVHFTGRHAHQVIDGGGHNLPQEKPQAFAAAVLTVREWGSA